MERPKNVVVIIKWVDEENAIQERQFNELDLEHARELIGLMTGDVTESDLEP